MDSGLTGTFRSSGTAGAGRPVPPLVGTLPPQCRKDVDTLRRLVRETMEIGPPAKAVSADAFQEVLLTGATGFVGRFLLQELLLRNSGLIVHCLVRARNEEHGLERIRKSLQNADIWEESLANRVRAVVGDIGIARFGLDASCFDMLCDRMDAVYHSAAELNLAASYLSIRKANAFSIRNVLELCLNTRLKHCIFISSMGLFPQYFAGFAKEFEGRRIEHHMQPDLAEMKRLFPLGMMGYPWSKLVAEQAVLFAHAAGLPAAIFRLPNTTAASNGFLHPDDIGTRILAAVVDVEMMPKGFSVKRSCESADVLSRVCAAISMNPGRLHTVYHCCDPRPALHDVEPADFGTYWPEVSYASFKRACQARGESSPLNRHWAILDHFAPYWFADGASGRAPPICDRAMQEDCPEPIHWPGLLTTARRTGDWLEKNRSVWPYRVAESRLELDCLLARCEVYAEREGVAPESAYPNWLQEGLESRVSALRSPDAGLRQERMSVIVWSISRLLHTNALLAGERLRNPEILLQDVRQPVFIVGINRTGTTLLHRLLARDKRFWALRAYECYQPVQHELEAGGAAAGAADNRRAALEDLFEATNAIEAFSGIHPWVVDEPEEDFPLLRLGFADWTALVGFHLPDYADWLTSADLRPAYSHHRRILQRFAWERRREPAGQEGQWLLKMPFHLKELEALLDAYPDALFIQTHRRPTAVMGSWNSLVERFRDFSIQPRSPEETWSEQLAFMGGMLNDATRFRQDHPELEDRWVDLAYTDLVRNPMAVVRSIYSRFGWRLEPDSALAMKAWLMVQDEQRRREKRHKYNLEDYGLTPEKVNSAFGPYVEFACDRGLLPSAQPDHV